MPHSHRHLILNKDTKTKLKRNPLPQLVLRELKLDPYLSPRAKTNSKCIKDFNIGPETLEVP
jgi:hypothetical protein